MSKPAKLPPGVMRACAGLLESEEALSPACRRAIQAAENAVGGGYTPEAEQQRQRLVQAVKLSLVNRKKWPYETLMRNFNLSLSYNAFGREKKNFCYAMAIGVGLVRRRRRRKGGAAEMDAPPGPDGEAAQAGGREAGRAPQKEVKNEGDGARAKGGELTNG